MSVASTADVKATLRRAMLERRRAAHRSESKGAAAAVSHRITGEIEFKGKIIAGYWPLGDELDCRPALEALSRAGAQVALPVVAGQGQVLLFRTWKPGDTLDQGPFGTMHPGTRAAVVCPQILLIPLIAFDLEGNRLGYGAGYYDRTISSLRARDGVSAIGLAYDCQRVDMVPVDAHDQPLDAVLTPSNTLWFD